MYKVLDVREYDSITGGEISTNNTSLHKISLGAVHYVVALCENVITMERKRFDFCKGFEYKMFGEKHYHGYIGEYNLIVPGDIIDIEETSTYKYVRRVN